MKAEGSSVAAGFASDPRLLPRIKQVVDASPHEVLDVDDVASELQRHYPEYARKKRAAFVEMVRRGMTRMELPTTRSASSRRKRKAGDNGNKDDAAVVVLDDPSDDEDSRNDRHKDYVSYPDTNMANRSLTSLYGKGKSAPDSGTKTTTNADTKTPKKKLESKKSLGTIPPITVPLYRPTVRFADLGGCERQFLDVCRLAMHLKHPEIHRRLGVTPPRGFLLHGPPGCGKTLFAEAVAGELEIAMLRLAATELISGVSGESEEKVRSLFVLAEANAPCVLFIDEIDAIAPKRETAQREMERRVVSQLIACLDGSRLPALALSPIPELGNPPVSPSSPASEVREGRGDRVLVIGATNRADSIEPALRRAGRFDKEIALGIPDERARIAILPIVCRDIRVDGSVVWSEIARLTPGYVGADLRALAREAAMCAVNRVFETSNADSFKRQSLDEVNGELQRMLTWLKSDHDVDANKLHSLFVTRRDFDRALDVVHPSAKREGFATVPDVSWSDIGALRAVREQLEWSILYPIKCPEAFERFAVGIRAQGILLCGPPGCGKTLLAKAVANETGMNFISVKGPELLSMYVGESERAVRTVFQRARDSAPCVIFFDEIDALCPKRSHSETSGSARLVNQLLTEMDGIEERKQVFLIGATNRPDIVDPAILRPGRLDKILFVDFPDCHDRVDILRKATKDGTVPALDVDVSLEELASDKRSEWFTGADLVALVREASVAALRANWQSTSASTVVSRRHFETALAILRPSVSEAERRQYNAIRAMYGSSTNAR